MVSNLNKSFREIDPDKRLRVTAIIEKTITEADAKINKKMFAKHLLNTKIDQKKIIDSTKSRIINSAKMR